MVRRRLVSAVAGTLGAVALVIGGGLPASATPLDLPCLVVSNQIVSQTVTLDPGETIQFGHAGACASGYYLGIRSYGAQSATSPVTSGVVESSLNGVTWTAVSGTAQDNNPSFQVRYTAPALPGSSDSFYVISAAYGASAAGYLYSVTVSGPSAGWSRGGGPDGTVWQLATARASADAPCPDGYGGSWAQWPNAGTGGWVCVRNVWAFDPQGRAGPA